MHPAKSVIFFTVVSGLGYGLLIWLGLYAGRGFALPPGWNTGVLVLAGVLIVAGLVSSTLHLGHPERAWRAFSQWRTSWLSREGVMAVATFAPMAAWGLGWLTGSEAGWIGVAQTLAMLGAVAVLVCTAMIYASIRAVRDWHTGWTVASYLGLGLWTGGLLFLAVLDLTGQAAGTLLYLVAVTGIVAAVAKIGYRRRVLRTDRLDAAAATGLSGEVRLLEAPHSQKNFLMREMGFEIARRHADALRVWMVALLFAVPALTFSYLPLVAAIAALAGCFVERWLFFAEARHAVMLYYGAARA